MLEPMSGRIQTVSFRVEFKFRRTLIISLSKNPVRSPLTGFSLIIFSKFDQTISWFRYSMYSPILKNHFGIHAIRLFLAVFEHYPFYFGRLVSTYPVTIICVCATSRINSVTQSLQFTKVPLSNPDILQQIECNKKFENCVETKVVSWKTLFLFQNRIVA